MSSFHQEILVFLSSSLTDVTVKRLDTETVILQSKSAQFCIIASALFSTPINERIITTRKKLILDYRKDNFDTLVIWEDQWISTNEIIQARIKSKLQRNKKIFARQCSVVNIQKEEAQYFLRANHLLGFFKAKYYLGLLYQNEVVAIASFGPIRTMKEEHRSTSSELIQFATLPQTSITGGLSKLITNFNKRNNIGDLMTYIPLEWSSGNSFEKVGFKRLNFTSPLLFLSENGSRVKNTETPNAFDTGNAKMLLVFD